MTEPSLPSNLRYMSLFTKIISREIPADIVFEDDLCLAFRDIHPQAPIHVLLIPKTELRSMNDVTEIDATLMSHLMMVIPKIAKLEGVSARGYRVVANTNADAGQTVPHLHFHILGGRQMAWPPG